MTITSKTTLRQEWTDLPPSTISAFILETEVNSAKACLIIEFEVISESRPNIADPAVRRWLLGIADAFQIDPDEEPEAIPISSVQIQEGLQNLIDERNNLKRRVENLVEAIGVQPR